MKPPPASSADSALSYSLDGHFLGSVEALTWACIATSHMSAHGTTQLRRVNERTDGPPDVCRWPSIGVSPPLSRASRRLGSDGHSSGSRSGCFLQLGVDGRVEEE